MTKQCWLDDGFDSIAPDVRRSAPLRLVLTLVFGLVLAKNIGWRVAVAWMVVGFGCTWWGYLASRAAVEGEVMSASTLVRFTAMITSSVFWTTMPIIYWMTGVPAFRLMAIVLLSCFLIVAQSYSFKSRLAVFGFGTAPAIAIVLLPIAFGAISGFQLFSLGLGLALVLLYLAVDVQQNVANARALRTAQADLLGQKEVAIAANQAKSSFLAMMSHELRTPMNGVLGMAHALTLTRLDPRQASHIDMLVRSGRGLMSILNDILDISKIESGKLELEIIAFDLHELGQRVQDLWSEAASAKGVRLIFDLAPNTPQWVSGDPTRLRQVMINLVSNALKFTGEGEVRLSIRPTGADRCEIEISDTGPGISEAQQTRLFQIFTQADVSISRKFGGTGLGLAICKQLVALMGGEIGVASREGEGSTFTFTVPLPPADPVEVADDKGAEASLVGIRILVADDNAINQAVARAILEAFGASVCAAGDGCDALKLLRADRFDVVLMDVHMPTMGGVEALSRIRAGEAGPRWMPVIALTADAMAGVDAELLAEGFDDVAPKPINPGELVAKIVAACAAAASDSRTRAAS